MEIKKKILVQVDDIGNYYLNSKLMYTDYYNLI